MSLTFFSFFFFNWLSTIMRERRKTKKNVLNTGETDGLCVAVYIYLLEWVLRSLFRHWCIRLFRCTTMRRVTIIAFLLYLFSNAESDKMKDWINVRRSIHIHTLTDQPFNIIQMSATHFIIGKLFGNMKITFYCTLTIAYLVHNYLLKHPVYKYIWDDVVSSLRHNHISPCPFIFIQKPFTIRPITRQFSLGQMWKCLL